MTRREAGVRLLLPLGLLLLVIAAFAAGAALRADLGLEGSVEAVRGQVQGMGLAGPALFVGLVTLRQFLFLPSAVLLTAGGLLFGAVWGALLGGLGIVASALMLFFLARGMGAEWVRPRLHARFPRLERRALSAGPTLIGLMTGHPMGVMTPFHLAAGISALPWTAYLVAVLVGGPVRAASYSFLGAHILDVGSAGFWLASALLVGLALTPLAHPKLRQRLVSRSG